MFRFFIFIFGLVAGFAAAIMVLPIPGKTFFNKMSRLPKNAKDIIDDSIDLGVAFFKLISVFAEDVQVKAKEVSKLARQRAEAYAQEGTEESEDEASASEQAAKLKFNQEKSKAGN